MIVAAIVFAFSSWAVPMNVGAQSPTEATPIGLDTSSHDSESAVPTESDDNPDQGSVENPSDASSTDPESATPGPAATAVDGTEAVFEGESSTGSLILTPDTAPQCVELLEGDQAVLPPGGFVDFACQYSVDVSGSGFDVATLDTGWSISAEVPLGWSMRLRTMTTNPDSWSDSSTGHVDWNDLLVNPAAESRASEMSEDGDQISGSISLQFDVRIERSDCTPAGGAVDLQVFGSVTAREPDLVTIESEEISRSPLVLAPFAPETEFAEPLVTIGSISLAPVMFSLEDQTTRGLATITVQTFVVQCETRTIVFSIKDPMNVASPGVLLTTSARGSTTDVLEFDNGTLISSGVPIAVLIPGSSPGVSVLTVEFEITIPGGLASGAFTLNASAFSSVPPG